MSKTPRTLRRYEQILIEDPGLQSILIHSMPLCKSPEYSQCGWLSVVTCLHYRQSHHFPVRQHPCWCLQVAIVFWSRWIRNVQFRWYGTRKGDVQSSTYKYGGFIPSEFTWNHMKPEKTWFWKSQFHGLSLDVDLVGLRADGMSHPLTDSISKNSGCINQRAADGKFAQQYMDGKGS